MKILVLKSNKVENNLEEVIYDKLESCEGYHEVDSSEYQKLVAAINFVNSKNKVKLEIVIVPEESNDLDAFLSDFNEYSKEENERLKNEVKNELKLKEEKKAARELAKKQRAVKQLAKKLGLSVEEVESRL